MSNDSNAPSDYFWRVPPGDAKKGWKELAKNHQCSLPDLCDAFNMERWKQCEILALWRVNWAPFRSYSLFRSGENDNE
jgi:hypothetical protein